MLNLKEHLLVKLSEECSEITKAAMKALRFGLDDRGPNGILTNVELVKYEIIDLYVVIDMMIENGLMVHRANIDPKDLALRRERIGRYMNYSRERGMLEK